MYLFFLYKSVAACTIKCNFPLPHVFPRPPFPLRREPTASAPRGDTLSTRINCYRSLFMSLVRGRKESKLVRSLVLYVKLGVRLARRLAGRTLNMHIPLISTLRISFRLSAIQTSFGYHRACTISSRSDITAAGDIIYCSTTATKLQYHLRRLAARVPSLNVQFRL